MKKIFQLSLLALTVLSVSCKKDKDSDTGPTNVAPTVSITDPIDGAIYRTSGSGMTVSITVNSADSDGTVSKVEIYDGSTLLNTVNDPAASYTFGQSLSIGNHVLKAVVTDNSNSTVTSSEVDVTIMPNVIVIVH